MNPTNKKKTILILLFHEMSAVNASLRLARQLQEQGYRVVYAGDSLYEKYVLIHHFEYRVLKVEMFYNHEIFKAFRQKGLPGKILGHPRMENRQAEHMLTELGKWLDHDPPDIVLLEQFMWFFSIPFLQRKIPIIGLNNCLAAAFRLNKGIIPPVFSGIIPGARPDIFSRIRHLTAWLKIYCEIFYDDTINYLVLRFGLQGMPALTYYKAMDLVKKSGGKILSGEYGHRLQVPELVFCTREFDFPTAPRGETRDYVGACVETKRVELLFDWGKIDKTKPLVYFSIGTHYDLVKYRYRRNLFRSVIEALRQRPHLQLLMHIAQDSVAAQLKPLLPANVLIEKWLPQLKILEKASVFISHGGLSSMRETLYSGVPVIVFPCFKDQPGDAARIVFHNLGLRGNIKKVNPGIVGNLIDRLMKDDSIRQSVKQMQEVFRKQETCQQGVDFIENILNKKGGKS